MSLSAVETLAAELWPGSVSVIVAVPDARKGERLILVTNASGANREAIMRHARAKGASELMVPAKVMVVPQVPLLGSGKPDFAGTQKLVQEKLNANQSVGVEPQAAPQPA